VITDFETTEQMLRHFVRRVGGRGRPSVVLCVPSGLTQVERNAVVEATLAAGGRQAFLIEEPLAAAIGAGLPVGEAVGSMVVDVGGGTTEIAVTALGGIVVSASLRVGGYDMDDAIVRTVSHEHGLLVGQEQAEEAKIMIGSAVEGVEVLDTTEIAGRDQVTGLLRRANLGSDQVRRALERPLATIVAAVKDLLEETPPELSSDIATSGLTLVGGGTMLAGFDRLVRRETGLPVESDPEPLTTVARGAGAALEEIETHGRRRHLGRR
jgi:rod shape-determining protein MreB